jgi:nitrite reductase/ring-hydroxylating ferredoxin subunit
MPFPLSKPKPDAQGFYPAGPSAGLSPGQLLSVEVADDTVFVTRLDGQLHAFSAACPHAAGDLRHGAFYRGRIDCPEHGYRFDVRSGRVLWPPDEVCRLKRYEVKEVDGLIRVGPATSTRHR